MLCEGKTRIIFMLPLRNSHKWPLCISGLQSSVLAYYDGLSLGWTFFKNLDESFLNIPSGLVLLFFLMSFALNCSTGLDKFSADCWPQSPRRSGTAAVCFPVNLYLL